MTLTTQGLAQTDPVAPPAAADQPSTVAAAEDAAARMTVPVMVNGHGPFPFVVDTGSNRTVISTELAALLALPPGPAVRVHGAVAPGAAGTARIGRIDVGSRRINNLVAPILKRGDLGAAGILGIDALYDQKIVMDFRLRAMTILPSVSTPDPPGTIVVTGKNRLGQLVFVDAKAGGVPLYVIIDTGGELTIGNSVLRDTLAGQKGAAVPGRVEVISVTGDRMSADVMTMPRMTLGGAIVGNLPIAYADLQAFERFGLSRKPAMLLGMNVLREFDRVSVDFKKRQVTFTLRSAQQASN